MIPLLAEGLSSALLPCSLTLAVPALAVALASRSQSTAGLIGFATSLIGFSWLRFSDRAEEMPRLTIAGLFAIGTVILVLPVIRQLDVVSALGGLLVGIASAALWEPCVGSEFGHLLDDLPTRGGSGMLAFTVYTVGVTAPMIAIGIALHILPDVVTLPLRPAMAITGVAALSLLSFTVAIGQQDHLLAHLTRLST